MKTKAKTYGKRFSRRTATTTTLSVKDSPKKCQKALKEWASGPAETFDYEISYWTDRAETILKERNLPCSGMLRWYRVDENEEWKTERPANSKLIDIVLAPYIINDKRLRPYMIMDKQRAPSLYTPIATYRKKGSLLEYYIVNDLGYAHDSPEGLAATILTLIEELKHPHADKLMLAYKLGKASTLLKVYGSESQKGRFNREAQIKDDEEKIKERNKEICAYMEKLMQSRNIQNHELVGLAHNRFSTKENYPKSKAQYRNILKDDGILKKK